MLGKFIANNFLSYFAAEISWRNLSSVNVFWLQNCQKMPLEIFWCFATAPLNNTNKIGVAVIW